MGDEERTKNPASEDIVPTGTRATDPLGVVPIQAQDLTPKKQSKSSEKTN